VTQNGTLLSARAPHEGVLRRSRDLQYKMAVHSARPRRCNRINYKVERFIQTMKCRGA